MTLKSLSREIAIWFAMLLPFVYLAWVWDELPERVPIHFNLQGEANGWGSKTGLIGIVFGLTVFINLLLLLIPKLDPKGKIENMGSKYDRFRLLMVLFMSALAVLIIYSASSRETFSPNLLFILIGGLFIVLGNYFQALKPNYFIGIRTPWTLESETVWKKTHRMGGRLWVLGGVLIILTSFLPQGTFKSVLFIATIAAVSLIPTVYSYLELRKEQRQLKL
ncbi:SdpI family protein [Pontibacter sp. SGAir0037]|uniref:SdpI family protein n=1 Tax=Pontibacter sp. SGAir0037 TaxID=2571030 RepID=UPI0010CCBDA7|nr:SdpI family protein [Pontibacter sp. SGAir0037]QCR24452.1 hypothetical protein C1N53_20210 [Pontibacter sp. SGAir0037]